MDVCELDSKTQRISALHNGSLRGLPPKNVHRLLSGVVLPGPLGSSRPQHDLRFLFGIGAFGFYSGMTRRTPQGFLELVAMIFRTMSRSKNAETTELLGRYMIPEERAGYVHLGPRT